jgi:hypothetical protein
MKQPKEQRFQLFLHEMHEPTAAAAAKSGRTLSSEVRHRVKASFVLDDTLTWLAAEIPQARGDRLTALIEIERRLLAIK